MGTTLVPIHTMSRTRGWQRPKHTSQTFYDVGRAAIGRFTVEVTSGEVDVRFSIVSKIARFPHLPLVQSLYIPTTFLNPLFLPVLHSPPF